MQFYKGATKHDNASSRVDRHNRGFHKSTKAGIPWVLVYEEKCLNFTVARKRENYLKSTDGRRWIKSKFGYLMGLSRSSA